MNYHYIKNKYETVKYDYSDTFDVKIYYLNKNYCQIDVKRLDSKDGWGLILEIIIFDTNNQIFEKIFFGDSNDNFNSKIFNTKIELDKDLINKVSIPRIVTPRNDKLISNKYTIVKNDRISYLPLNSFLDLHVVIYYVDINKIKIIIRRLDEELGWDDNLKLILYDHNNNMKEIIDIGNSEDNYKYLFKDTKVSINFIDHNYEQDIPKIIFQTGYSSNFKNILHFNSIISFIELNPEYLYIYYTDYDSRIFLKDNFSEEINYAYYLLVPGAYKADLIRYCFLYHFGGCYFDCKQILRLPIRNFLNPETKILFCNDAIERALLNAIIFSTSKNKIMEKTIKDCIYNVIHKLGKTPLDVTGPTFFYKSIKKYITKENLLLQNHRPPDNFEDFSNDYYNNNVKIINSDILVLNRFYKGYYSDYLDKNHYGKLFNSNEVYYKNFQTVNNFKIFIYPNKFNDKFYFNIDKTTLIIKRSDSKIGWNFHLKVIIIDNNLIEHKIDVGTSESNVKIIEMIT